MSNDTNSTSSAASCAKGHVFFYAGALPIPDGWPCACGMMKHSNSTTNDPQAAYGERKFNEGFVESSRHTDHLIASGELIVKSELIEWLEGWVTLYGKDSPLPVVHGMSAAYQKVIDHINKKP